MTIKSLEMTKKTEKKTEKKTAKKVSVKKKTEKKLAKDRIISVATLKKIDSKLSTTKESLENQVEDLNAQVKKVSKKSSKKALKLLKELDESYHRRLVNLQTEFEEQLASLSKVKDKVLELIPNVLTGKVNSDENETAKSEKVIHKTPTTKLQPRSATKTSTIASIKSIGPVMQKKLAAEGITTLDDIANTPKSKIESLKQFEKERGFDTWEKQAIALLASNSIKASL
ncbi:MAG: putative flap endonuclease-1-like 5' DNA nuclease [Oleiphilaceae bacterium]|jgi:predicted flap endonuclease-1-like 5' DNA nuclease